MDSPEGGIFVEVADNILAIFDLAEKVFLTWDFSVLSMAFTQPLLQKRKRRLNTLTFKHNKEIQSCLMTDLRCEQQ